MSDTTFLISGGFFDAVDSDRLYSADQMNQPYKKLIHDGINREADGTTPGFAVTAGSGMNVLVATGNAMIGGKWAENKAVQTIAVAGNTSGSARIDSIILQCDKSRAVRAVQIVYRQGTTTAPGLVSNNDITELRLANIRVQPAASAIASENITDTRGGAECPWVRSVFDAPDARYIVEEYTGSELAGAYQTVKSAVDSIRYAAQSGQPTVALQASEMIDSNLVYLYQGSETGYSTGYLYYYSDAAGAWIRGAQYGASVVDTALDEDSENPVQNKAVTASINGLNVHLDELDNVLGIDTREGTAFDFTDEEYSAGAIVNSINIIDVPLTNCKIKSITLAMNTSKALDCMIYVVKSDLTVVKTIEGTSESAGMSHTVSIDYDIEDEDTYYIGIYLTKARAVTFGPAQTSVQTRCYEFNPSILLIGAQTKADKRRIRASLLIETAGENKITALETDVEYMGERITALENKSEESLPSYYTDYLPAKIETLLSLDAEVGSHGDSFVFMTDYHDASNTGYSPEVIKQIVEKTATKMIVFGGDIINQYATKEQAYPHFADFHKRFLFSNAYYPIIGNHEYNDPGNTDAEYTGKRMTFSEAYGMNLRQKEIDPRYEWDGGYIYHVDNRAQKIRYYLVGCNATATIEAESRNAFFASLESVPTDYTVIVIAHQLAAYNNGNPVYGTAGQLIANGCDAYNARQIFTANGISHDYTGATGKIILLMQGHTHIDFDLTTTGGIPSVCTTCDSYALQLGSLVRTAGTATEQAFDIVHVNTDAKTIKFTRIGAGTNRVFTYA